MSRIVAFTYDRTIDRRILLQLRSLKAQGHEVELYANAGDAAQDPTDIVIHRLLPRTVRGRAGILFRVLGTMRRHAPGLLVKLMPFARPLAWSAMQARPDDAYRQLFAEPIAKAGGADLYIAYDLPMLAVGAAAKSQHGGKLFYDSHELFCEQHITDFERRMWTRVEREHIAHADAVITVNASIARELQQRYGLAHVGVVHNAEWLPEHFPPREKLFHRAFNLPETARILLYQGGLSAHRNLDRLVEAMQHTARDTHLVLLGSGPLLESLRTQVRTLGLEGRVHLHPHVPQRDLLRHSMAADLGVIPYVANCLNHTLCTPNKLFEFIIAGLPMLGSDLPEIRGFIQHYGLGDVCAMDDPMVIARALDALMQPQRLAQLRTQVEAARERVNWQQESAAFLQAITPLL